MNPPKYRYFSADEFPKCVPPCRIDQMSETFLELLDVARHIAGVPFVLNSCYRSESYERSKSRSGFSMHTLGRAADISCRTSDKRYKIVSALLRAGFKGIGISKTFIHVDNRNADSPLIWLYNEKDD